MLCPPGTLLLWIFWPSFNSVLVEVPNDKRKAVLNTYYALAVSAVTATSMSALSHPQGKINMVRRRLPLGQHVCLCLTYMLTAPTSQALDVTCVSVLTHMLTAPTQGQALDVTSVSVPNIHADSSHRARLWM